MTYNISRYEHNRDHDGNITSIFLAVYVNNGEEGTYYEHWLTEEEKTLVLADEANLKPILEECFAQAELKLENELATKPMPKIEPLQEVGKKETLESIVVAKNIASKKTAIMAEKLALVEEIPSEVI